MDTNSPSLETLQDIRKIMDRSTRFISLSGLSGISAGILALIACYFASGMITEYFVQSAFEGAGDEEYKNFVYKLLLLAVVLLAVAMAAAFYFTWRKAGRDKVSLWDINSRRMAINLAIPLAAGGLFILGMLYHGTWQFVVPASLMFYGLALLNAGKYTYRDIRYLGILQLIVGSASFFYIGYGLYFWAFGFGILHIIYGSIMWWKYER